MAIAASVAIALAGGGFTTQRPARPVTVASGSWAPFVGPDLGDDAPIARIVSETLQREGFDPTITYSSWPLALERTERSEVFGTFPFISSAERRQDFLLSDPLIEFEYVLFFNARARPAPPEVRTAADLDGLRIGKAAGYDVWPALEDAVDQFVTYGSSLEAFRALADGEIDLLPEGLLPGRALIRDPDLRADAADFEVLEAAGNPLLSATETLHFMMPRTEEAARLMSRFDESLAVTKETSLYEDAVAALGTDTEGQTVELAPLDGQGAVEMIDQAAGSTLLAPRGTKALVLEWPEAYVQGAPSAPSQPLVVRAKVLNGPARGRVVLIDARAVRLPGPSG